MAKRAGIQTLRLNAMLTQTEFATALGVTVQSVQAWEAGTTVPRPGMQRTMLTVLGVTREQMLEALETTQRERVLRERARERDELLAVAEPQTDEAALGLADRPTRKRKKRAE